MYIHYNQIWRLSETKNDVSFTESTYENVNCHIRAISVEHCIQRPLYSVTNYMFQLAALCHGMV